MAEILKEWLTERLQRPISWVATDFGNMMKNGFIVAGVLYSYHIINEEQQFLIRSSNNPEEIKNNWKYLCEWLRGIDLPLANAELENIMDGKSGTVLRLFYKLFLCLDKRDRTNFIKRERKMVSDLIEKTGHRFKVAKVPEEEESFVDDLTKPLLNEKHFIEWQRKKADQVKEIHDFIRHKYSKTLKRIEESKTPLHLSDEKNAKLSKREQNDIDKFALKYPCKFENYTYDDLLALEQKTNEHKESIAGSEWARNYIDNLHKRLHKKSDSEEFQKQLSNTLSGSLWDKAIAEEETNNDTELAKKVMKLSQFEKQMCTQIMETKQQARNLIKNSIRAEKEYAEQREQQFNHFFDNIKEQIQLESEELDFEKKRQNMLHKKLYAEKIRRKRLHYYEICYETMLSIVDYATKYAYFKILLENDIPNRFIHEWKSLYYKCQPIFDILEPMEDILTDRGIEEENVSEVEEIIRLELVRQEALNENEFKEYHDYSYPWALELLIPNYDPESEERKYEYLGTRILGHVVFTLLHIKYPSVPQRPPADLPRYSAKALIRGLPDRSLSTPMQILLNASKIQVVRIEAAINYCLRKFKTEMIGSTDVELSFDKFISVAQEDSQKELIKQLKTDDDAGISKMNDIAVQNMLGTIPANTKQTQTPKSLPEVRIELSPAAELGKYVYETLSSGDSITDHLLVAMLVEYLKSLDDIRGFVIINYPNSYREAQILEETFSGVAPPDEDDIEDRDEIYLEETIAKHRKKEKDIFKTIRISKLVNDPHKKIKEKPFESYFTSYIRLKESEDILKEPVIWDLNEENSELIDRFYAVLGINYSMYYDSIDKEFLAQLCQYIIGDIIPQKSVNELFGENVLSELDFFTPTDKRRKFTVSKPDVANAKSREKLRSGLNKFLIGEEDIQELNTEEEEDSALLTSDEINEAVHEYRVDDEVKILAGEEDWEYGSLPIAELIAVALATCWEEIEKTYIHNMQQLFFSIRLQMNCLVPYTRYIKDKMQQAITLPSIKQDLVCAFQKEYNDFENDWRDINFTRNEWHCRIKELQNKLYQICDERKINAQQLRRDLISDNWAMEELTTMVNSYISCMQSELNRSILTYQILHDFYFTMLKRLPSADIISSKDLTKIYRESDNASGSKRGIEDKVFKQLKTAFQDLQHKNIAVDVSNNPFNVIIENNVKFALKVIKDTNDSYRSTIAKEYTEIAKIQSSVKKKDDTTSEVSINTEDVYKYNALKCIEEWTMGVNGEMFRANLRILSLQYKCYKDMKLFNDLIFKTFVHIQDEIDSYYMNEIKSVDRLCKYLQLAVENGKRIPETLILENDTFVIDPNLLQFALPEPLHDEGDAKEIVGDTEFKISQLAKLRSQFKIVAPTGLALQQAFIYILQDFTIFGKETCDEGLLPEFWIQVDPEQISKFVFSMFGDTVYIDWRDFLIYCLNIRYPTVEELLAIRKLFRCKDLKSYELISRDNYMKEELWFENEFDLDNKTAQLRKHLIKHFLFELFETEHDIMNYSAFLLAFCKSIDPIKGFVTALSVAIGKTICFSLNECSEVIQNLIKRKQYKDACKACALKCAGDFLDTLVTRVLNDCEGTTIVELQYVPPPDDKKSKKGKKVSSKHGAKNIESSNSARSASKLTNKSRLTQSTSNVKSTYICPPCEVEPEAEKIPEKQEIEEEHRPEPQADENLVYAVSQSVIWNVLRICLPWHFELTPEEKKTPYISQVRQVLNELEVDTDNGDVYVAKFVANTNICKMLHSVKKFTALNFVREVKKIFV